MNTWQKIVEMTRTPSQRENLNSLADKDKMALILELTDSKNFIDVLEYVTQAEEDAEWCNSYR